MKEPNPALRHYFVGRPCCIICKKPNRTGLHPHHLLARGLGGGGHVDIACNLAELCADCHQQFHDGNIPREVVVRAVAWREGLLPGDVLGATYRVRQRPKGIVFDPWSASDGEAA